MNMYFIALVAPEEINRQVTKWKLWTKEKYSCEAALRSPAHITLIPPFWMKPELEDDLRQSISTFSASQIPAPVHLKNFSNFKPRVIFVDVMVTPELANLESDLVDYL